MTKNLLWLSCATSALVLGAGGAQAATATAADTASSETGGSVAELVVVAEHRETALQKIPVAVSVFTGAQRDVIGISSVQDVTNFAPGFVYDTTTTHPYIRGVGRQSVNVTDDERVASYEDELFVYTAYELKQSSLFLTQEQIERGPQNVGGRNAAAGSIDMISVRPTDHPYAEVRVSGANYGAYNIEAAASGQIAPGLTARIAGSYLNQDEGYFRNLARPANVFGGTQGGDQHEWYVQAQLDWKPTDRDDVWVKGFWSGWDRQGGDAGGRAGSTVGPWDEVNLSDADTCLICSIWVNANYGYAAPGGNPAARAAVLAGGSDLVPIAVTLANPNILDNPSTANQHLIATTDPLDHTVNLKNYRGIQLNYTHDFDGWQMRYITGIQGYDYDLDEADGDTNVVNFTLPGNGVGGCGIFAAFGIAPSCSGSLFGLSFAPGIGAVAQNALLNLSGSLGGPSNLLITPNANLHYTEDDYWWSHELTFQSTNKGPFQWEVGAWWYNQHYTNPITWTAPQPNLAHPAQILPFLGSLASTGNFAGLVPFLEFVGETPAQAIGSAGVLNAAATGLVPAAANPNDMIALLNYDISVHSVAGYGQFSYAFNDQLKVTGNIRYSSDSKGGTENTRDIGFDSTFIDLLAPFFGANTPSFDLTPLAVCLSGNPIDCNSTAHGLGKGVLSMGVIDPATGQATRRIGGHSAAFTGGAGIEYTPTNDIFIYARYGRGYEDIAFNAGFNSANPEVGPEFLNSYEVGYKQNFGGKLRVDAAVFYYDYEQIQLPISVNVAGILQNEFINAPKAESTGFELEGYWSPIKPLSFTLSYSFDYTAVLTDCTGTVAGGILTPAPGALCLVDTQDPAAVEPGSKPVAGQSFAASGAVDQSIKGDPLPGAPLNKIALNAAYTWNFDPGDFTLSGSVEWRDAQNGTVFNVFSDKAPSWYGIDLRALWKGKGDKYEILAYVKNLTNTYQYQTGTGGPGYFGSNTHFFSAATGLLWENSTNLAPPRTYGIEMRYKFF